MGKKQPSVLVIGLAILLLLFGWIFTIAFYLTVLAGAVWLFVNLVLKPLGFIT